MNRAVMGLLVAIQVVLLALAWSSLFTLPLFMVLVLAPFFLIPSGMVIIFARFVVFGDWRNVP